jgi:hypothetical protein
MIYLNQCPECKSKNITFQKKIRFFKTMLMMFLLSILPLIGWITDANKLATIKTSGDTPIDNLVTEALHPGYNALSNEMVWCVIITMALWVMVIVFFLIKKITYQCKDCNLQWSSQK